jgi:hypothetical protein
MVALVGVAGESLVLRHELVDSYPFKMMTFPPWQFYEALGNWSAVAAVVAAAVVGVWRLKSPLALPPLLTAIAPLFLLAIVASATSVRYGFSVPAGVRNFDGYTVNQATFDLGKTAVIMSLAGLLVGSICSVLFWPFARRWRAAA